MLTVDDESTVDEDEELMQVFAQTFGDDTLSSNQCLSTGFGSPYLLTNILEKLIINNETVPRFLDIFLIVEPEGYQKYVQAGITFGMSQQVTKIDTHTTPRKRN